MLVGVFAFASLFGGLICLFFLLRAVFMRRSRKRQILHSGWALLVVIGSLVGFGVTTDQEARDHGFLGSVDKTRANEAGYTDATAWAEVRERQKATRHEEAKAAAADSEEITKAVDGIVAYVTEITGKLPSRFEDHGIMIPEEARMQPLADDVMAYANFYWTVDSIESNCRFLGQRTNIEILSPRNGVTSWVSTASTSTDHPNHAEYLEIFEKFHTAVTEFGEAAVCPAIYRLLGPNGSLMDDALDINGLIDPEVLDRWEVRTEDGILWSSRDYCDRRYYLEQAPQQTLHDSACNEAKVQDF